MDDAVIIDMEEARVSGGRRGIELEYIKQVRRL